ncbi:hypothetical protein A7311_07345 [Paenibacillus polymyxa]|nr:hypothetical protein A7311_07345 [Paenibacillus polymyxa]
MTQVLPDLSGLRVPPALPDLLDLSGLSDLLATQALRDPLDQQGRLDLPDRLALDLLARLDQQETLVHKDRLDLPDLRGQLDLQGLPDSNVLFSTTLYLSDVPYLIDKAAQPV